MLIICRTDLHSEVAANGTVVQLLQLVQAQVAATQSLLRTASEPVLRKGDKFACNHLPRVGSFAEPLPAGTGEGTLQQAGQQFVRINGVLVATLNGTNEACSECLREMDNRPTAFLTNIPNFKINGSPVLTGPRN